MAINSRKEAIANARRKRSNVPGMCQQTVRDYFGAPSAGDQDGDHDADATDGWLSEPVAARHEGDRNPPAGYPLYFKNKAGKGHAHRALSMPQDKVRSTDFSGATKKYAKGKVGTGTIAEVEKALNLVYVGWSETIDGFKIPAAGAQAPTPADPTPPTPTPAPAPALSKNIAAAVKALTAEVESKTGQHKHLVNRALRILTSINKK